jgi:CubicO group peptidase (beta-lactamase class C family)
MRTSRLLVSLSLLAACAGSQAAPPPPAPAAAEPTTTPPAAEKPADAEPTAVDAGQLEAELDRYVAAIGKSWGPAQRFSGFVLVAQGDRVLYGKGFGAANRDTGEVPDADTSFRIGSVTKQFTATAIMKLQEQGKLSVSDPIKKYLPDYPEVGADITLRQLLTHTSGIPSYTDEEELMDRRARPISVEALLASFWNRPLAFPPGSRFAYSNSNYIVLGAIIEKVTGASYADYMQTHVFAPAGLTRTVVGDADDLANRALGYQPGGPHDRKLVPAHPIDMSVPFAAGAVRSTATDLWKWDRALASGKVLSQESLAELYRPEKNHYAEGWFVGESHGHRVLAHGGGIDGFLTAYRRVPDEDLVVVAWSNNSGVDPGRIARAAVSAAFGDSVPPPDDDAPGTFDPALAARAAGHYRITEEGRNALAKMGLPASVVDAIRTIDLEVKDGALVLDPAGQPAVALTPLQGGRFGAPSAGITLTLSPATGDAPVETVTLEQRTLSISYERDRTPPH